MCCNKYAYLFVPVDYFYDLCTVIPSYIRSDVFGLQELFYRFGFVGCYVDECFGAGYSVSR